MAPLTKPITSRAPAHQATLQRSAGLSLAEQLAQRLATRIRDHLLAPGARLPSVRQCAEQQGLSPSTVVAAYDLLQAQGLVQAERGRGFFVRAPSPSPQTTTGKNGSVRQRLDAPVNAAALIRGMFQPIDARPQPGMGVLPVEWLDTPFLGTALRRVCASGTLADHALRYGEPQGDLLLRQFLSTRLHDLGLPVDAQQIVTTVGATHALDVISRTLLRPGDAVLVEEPGWAVDLARLQGMGMRVLPVPRGPQGPDLAVMTRLCQTHAPKLFICVSVLHNPTGACLSAPAAHRLLQLAQQFDFFIAEDDTYSHIAPEHAVRLSVLDGLQRTIYVSGFSKILVPNWRVGYLAAPQSVLNRLIDTKLLATLSTPSLLEHTLALCMEQGHLRRHADRIRQRLADARQRSTALARAHDCPFIAQPDGMFGWVDTGVDTEALAQRMLDHDVLLAPGALFFAGRAPSTLMRINFAATQQAAFWRLFARERDLMLKKR